MYRLGADLGVKMNQRSTCQECLLKEMWLLFHPPFDHELWTRMNLPINPSCKRSTGGEWLPLPVQGVVSYVVCWNICDRDQDFWSAKSVLDRLIISSKALDRFIFLRVKGRIGTVRSWSFDFCSSEATLILWSALRKDLIAWFILIPVANASTQDI